MTATITVDLSMLYFVAANTIAILMYVLMIKYKSRKLQRATGTVATAIVEYFRTTGMPVSAKCVSLDRKKSFTAIIETEPKERFHLSRGLEAALREHVNNSCNLSLHNVCWRFIPEEERHDDDYVPDGPKFYAAEEGSLEMFEKLRRAV
jgi:hypothetical protein